MRDVEKNNPEIVENNENNEIRIDLVELFLRLVERWKYIVIGAAVGTIIMAVYSFMFASPVYEATSKLYVIASSDSAINLSDLQIGSYLTSDYTEVFKTWEVHEIVRQNLGLDYSRSQLSRMITIENPSDTRVIYITVENEDPQLAADIANEYAAVARQYISMTMQTDEPTEFSKALVPDKPVGPRKKLNVALGFIFGALAVCAVIVVQFLMDDKIKTSDDIRRYAGLPTLAVIPDNDEAAKASPIKSEAAAANAQKRGEGSSRSAARGKNDERR